MTKGKKKGRKPAHQNTFAFRHNPKSKLTEKILASPNEGVCRRCHDKIEWRKAYRKYKPLSQPSKCNICQRKNVTAAYHTICKECSVSEKAHQKMVGLVKSDKENENMKKNDNTIIDLNGDNKCVKQTPHRVCAVCCKARALSSVNDTSDMDRQIEEQISKLEKKLGRTLKLRESKAIERKVQREAEKDKIRAKEERRRLRMESMKTENGIEDEDESDNEDSLDKSCHEGGEDLDDGDMIVHSDGSVEKLSNYDEEEDPFLQAIGGACNLLTGEAYQQMILTKEATQ